MSAIALLGCGGGATGAAAAGKPSAPVVAEPPPLPDEPLLMLPSGPRLLARADVAQLRGSRYFDLAKRFLRQAACIEPAAAPWLLERTDKLALAGFGDGALPELLAIAYGRYDAADAQQAASQWFATRKLPLPAMRTQGRVTLWSGPEQSIARVGDKLLVAGPTARVQAALVVSEGKQPSALPAAAFIPELDASSWLETHSVALLAQLDPRTARRFGAGLDDLGAGEIRQGLDHGAAAFSLTLTRDAHAELEALYADPRQAEAAAGRIRDLLGQASFVLRLMGLPEALTRMDVRNRGSVLSLALSLSEAEAEDLEQRFVPMLESSLPACNERAELERGPQLRTTCAPAARCARAFDP